MSYYSNSSYSDGKYHDSYKRKSSSHSSSKHKKKRRSRSRSSDEEEEKKHYDFSRHKSKLTKMFFRPSEDFVEQGTKEYHEFWEFLNKYQKMEKAKQSGKHRQSKRNNSDSDLSENLGLPSTSNPSSFINFNLKPEGTRELMNRIPFQDHDARWGDKLTEQMIKQFRVILGTYINFLQREKFSRLRKLRAGQAALPIAEYREQIVETVRENQVRQAVGTSKQTGIIEINTLLDGDYDHI